MDKQPNKISIKINGQEKEYKEPESKVKKQEQAAKDASSQEEFSWVLPEEPPSKIVSIEDLRHVKSKKKKPSLSKKSAVTNKNGASTHVVKKVVIIMSVAILVGSGLGMFSLKMMTGEDSVFVPQKTEPVAVTNSGLLEEPGGTGELAEEKPSATLPAFSLYAVQAGVFSTKKGGEDAIRNLRAKGYAAAVIPNEQSYALFIGVGLEEKVTKKIGEHYKKQGESTYVKPYDIPSIQMDAWSKNEQTVMTKALKPFSTLLSLSSETAANPSASLSGLKGVKEELVKLKSNEKLDQNIGKFLSYLLMAEASLSNYAKTEKEEARWQAQQFLLEAVSVYAEMK